MITSLHNTSLEVQFAYKTLFRENVLFHQYNKLQEGESLSLC